MSQLFCKATDVWRVVSNWGEIRPCCVYRGDIGRLQTGGVDKQKLETLKRNLQNNIRVPECSHCWFSEDSNIRSHRLGDEYWTKQGSDVQWLEFNFSNLCNLACIMCNSSSSTSWIPFEQKLYEDPNTSAFRHNHTNQLVKAFPSKKELYDYLNGFDIQKIKRLVFKGGEPLLQKEIYQTIDYFLERGKTDILIMFTSSGLSGRDKLMKFSAFNAVEFTFSVEATGPLYQYIRGGSQYTIRSVQEAIAEVKKIPNFRVISNSCISAYSYFDIVPLIFWLKDNIPDLPERFLNENIIPLDQPDYLSHKAIPLESRERAFEHNVRLMKTKFEYDSSIQTFLTNTLKLHEKHDPVLHKRFVAFTKKNDQMRKMKFADLVPEYADFF